MVVVEIREYLSVTILSSIAVPLAPPCSFTASSASPTDSVGGSVLPFLLKHFLCWDTISQSCSKARNLWAHTLSYCLSTVFSAICHDPSIMTVGKGYLCYLDVFYSTRRMVGSVSAHISFWYLFKINWRKAQHSFRSLPSQQAICRTLHAASTANIARL